MLNTIIDICEQLEDNNVEYFLIGGTSLFIRKLIETTKDIDLAIKKENLKKIQEIFNEKNIKITEKSISFYHNGYEVELIIVDEKADPILNKVFKEKKYEYININNKSLKIISLKDLLKMYKAIYKKNKNVKYLKKINYLKTKYFLFT